MRVSHFLMLPRTANALNLIKCIQKSAMLSLKTTNFIRNPEKIQNNLDVPTPKNWSAYGPVKRYKYLCYLFPWQ